MTLQQLIEEKGPYMVADEIQYLIQHHVGIKLDYLKVLQGVLAVQSSPEEDMSLEDFVGYAISAMHESFKIGYLTIP